MKLFRVSCAALTIAGLMTAQAIAGDFGRAPTNYQADAVDYISSRVEESRGVRVQFQGQPYQVYADIGRYQGLPAWAVDVRVRSKIRGGNYGGFQRYTVIFVDGDPVALEQDDVRLTRL